MTERTESIRRACDMRTETVRHTLAKGIRHGQPYEVADHLELHRESFLAGAQAMADAITIEQAALKLRELAEQGAAGSVIVNFPAELMDKHTFLSVPR